MRVALRAGITLALAISLTGLAHHAEAYEFSIPYGDDGIKAVLNTSITAGAQIRMQKPSEGLIGKANINPDACGRQTNGNPLYQSCQGLFKDQIFPAVRLSQVPGAFSNNFDDGDLNYQKDDVTQAPLKMTQDLTLTYKDYGFFMRGLFFHDFVNDAFTENHPNRITNDNYLDVGFTATAANNNGLARNDSQPCSAARNPSGGPCGIVYGAGGQVNSKRSDSEIRRQIGQNFQLLDAVFYGKLPVGEKELTFKLGRQTINWGESTLIVINSLNQAQPVNANNFLRTGFAVEEVFTPQASLLLSMQPIENLTTDAFYDFQWQPVEIPTVGSYFSFADVGTRNTGSFLTASFGGAAEDADGRGRLLDNALSGLTDTSLQIQRLPDNKPKSLGLTNQFGFSMKYYAEWLNSGTELGLYFMNYHSKLPYISVYATIDSCARNSRSTTQFLNDCPNIPLLWGVQHPNDPGGARSLNTVNSSGYQTYSAVPFDSARFQFEYPKNINMFGLSFNTTVGSVSMQGEIAYRPQMPLQVDPVDLLFAAFGPTLTKCQDPTVGGTPCAGTGNGSGLVVGALPASLSSTTQAVLGAVLPALAAVPGQPTSSVGGVGTGINGQCPGGSGSQTNAPTTVCTVTYGSSDFVVDGNGTRGGYNDTFDLLVGHAVGSSRAFPSFVVPYRGGKVGMNPGSDPTKPYDHNNPGYIRGWETLDVLQTNIGFTQVLGATDQLSRILGADQVLNLLEIGSTYVPDLPPLDVLQFAAPGTQTHASAGADGSGADRSRQACSTDPTCSFGPDGLRFNPHQANLHLFPTQFSWGYRLISLIRYESVLPGISFQPQIIWQHDVDGTAPQPLDTNFVRGRKTASINIESRYKSAFSIVPGYTWFFGGGAANNYRDRDFAQVYMRYLF